MKKSQSGLTFLELTAWVLIVAVLAVLAAPKYMEMAGMRPSQIRAADR